jgi:hypothetical protein
MPLVFSSHEFTPKAGWKQKGDTYIRIFHSPFEKTTERILTVQKATDGLYSLDVSEMNPELGICSCVRLVTTKGKGYCKTHTQAFKICETYASKRFKGLEMPQQIFLFTT